MEWIIGLVIGLAIGGVVAWLIRSAQAKSQSATQTADLRAEVASLNGQLQQAATAQQILDDAKEQLSVQFQAVASTSLQSNNEQFVQLANENLGKTLESAKSEFHQRHQQFQELVKPLAENYGKLNPQIETLTTQVQAVTSETSKLSGALTSNRQVGSWGEIQLRRIVELAGMSRYSDFTEQEVVDGGRPDLVVRLPDDRAVVVDAKAALAAHVEASQAADADAANAAWGRHAAALKSQVDGLEQRAYGDKVAGSLDFVVMFVPGDQFLASALAANPDLVDYALAKRVAIATPASLVAMLWTVASGWERVRLAEDAEKIRAAGEEMHKRMLTFISHYQDVGVRLNRTVEAFNRSVGTFDSRVIPQGRRFAELTTGSDESVRVPQEIDQAPRISRYAEISFAEDTAEAA